MEVLRDMSGLTSALAILLGVLSIAAGVLAIAGAVSCGDELSQGLMTGADILEQAGDAVRLVGTNLSGSSGLTSRVSSALSVTVEAPDQLGRTLDTVHTGLDEVASACRYASDGIAGMSSALSGLVPTSDLTTAASKLDASAAATEETMQEITALRTVVMDCSGMLEEVSASVDSFSMGMEDTGEGLSAAADRLSDARTIAMGAASSSAIGWVVAGVGGLLTLQGLVVMLLGLSLRRVGRAGRG